MTFNLRLIFGVTTVLCIALALGIAEPGIGVAVGAIATPALIRAAVEVSQRESAGLSVGVEDRLMALIAALGLMSVTFMVTVLVFFAFFWIVALALAREPEHGPWFAIGAGFIPAAYITRVLLRSFWSPPLKRKGLP